MNKISNFPNFGIGIGFRMHHYEEICVLQPNIDWFEIISEHYLVDGGKAIECLETILERYPVVQHGVSLAIGSPTPLDFDYLKKLKKLIRKTKSPWVSDHLSWGRLPGADFHDLLPLPHTAAVVDYVVERARIVQDFLEVPFALENLSTCIAFQCDELPEWEFYGEIYAQTRGVSTLLEWDDNFIPFEDTWKEALKAKKFQTSLATNAVIE